MNCRFAVLVCLGLTVIAIGRGGKSVKLRGRVVDNNSQSVAGAEVVAIERCYDYYRGPDYAKMLTSVQRTNSEGEFLLKVITTSQYNTYVVVRKEGYALGWDALNYNHFNDKAEGNFYIILEKPNTLAGKIVDAKGVPVAGAIVQAAPKTSYLYRLYQRPIYAPEKWFTDETSNKGTFAFKNLSAEASADFWVQVPGNDLIYHYTPHQWEAVGYEVGIEDLKLVLPHGTTIQGKVVDERGGGVSGVRLLLQLQDPRNGQYQRYRGHELVSGSDGRFSIRGVPKGKHLLRVITPSDRSAEWIARTVIINVAGDEDFKNVTVKVEKGAMLDVIARDRITEQPLSGVQVFVRKIRADRSKGFFRIADTGSDGIAHIRVPPGRWNVSVWKSDGYTFQWEGVQATAIRSRPSRVEIMLEPRFRIRGTVLEDSGRPAQRAVVSIYPHGDSVFTDNSGRFEGKTGNQVAVAFIGARDVGRNLAGLPMSETSRAP